MATNMSQLHQGQLVNLYKVVTLLSSNATNVPVDPSNAHLCRNATRNCVLRDPRPQQGFMATIVMVLLLCLVIAYCCWGACCKMFRKRRSYTNGEEEDDEASCNSEEATTSYASVAPRSRGCSHRSYPRTPKPFRTPQAPPPTYESIFGTELTMPPSYSTLDLQPCTSHTNDDSGTCTLLSEDRARASVVNEVENSTSPVPDSVRVCPEPSKNVILAQESNNAVQNNNVNV